MGVMKRDKEAIEDQLLVMDAQDGSAEAMNRLVDRWQRRLWLHALRLTGDEDAAWDVVQQTWLAIVRGLRRLEDAARFPAWAFRIVTHKASDWLRRRKTTPVTLAEGADRNAAAERGSDDSSGLHELLGMMDAAQSALLWLRYFERFTTHEISTVLGVPAGTVKSRLSAARAELKRLWQTHYGKDQGERP
jgi:RNA polymerase sigma-70 factor (ECF subfamily)